MSVDCLLNAEQVYFDHDPNYRQSVYDWLKGHQLPLRRAYDSDNFSGMNAVVSMATRIKGASRFVRGKNRGKWRFVKRRH